MKKIRKYIAMLLVFALAFSAGAGLFSVPASALERDTWVTTWGSALVNGSISLGIIDFQDIIPAGSTLRTELPVTTKSNKLNFTFSNQYGTSAITIDAASVAKTSGNGSANIVDGTAMPITFNNGETSVTIPAGESVTSDRVAFSTEALEYISVSLYFSRLTYMSSVGLSNGRTFMRRGILNTSSQVNSANLSSATEISLTSGGMTYHTIPFLERIDALVSGDNAGTAVFIGDSTLVNDTYLYYAERLVSAGVTNLGIVNEAIIGNKLLSDGTGIIGNLYGQAMLDRFKRDTQRITGIKYCFVKIGINDVLHQYSASLSAATPKHTAEDIIEGYIKLINRCHNRGIKIYFFTKSAWKGYTRSFLGSSGDLEWNEEAQKMCDELTYWIKNNSFADGYIDCDKLSDPADNLRLRPSFTQDGIHLNDRASIALADLIPLQFVGVTAEGKSAAALTGIDPYADPAPPQQPTSNAEPSTGETTTAPDETTTAPTETTTLSEDESYTVFEEPSSNAEELPSYEIPTGDQNTPPPNQDVNYVISEENTPQTIGNGGTIGFILAFVLVASVAVTMGALTLSRKKEND